MSEFEVEERRPPEKRDMRPQCRQLSQIPERNRARAHEALDDSNYKLYCAYITSAKHANVPRYLADKLIEMIVDTDAAPKRLRTRFAGWSLRRQLCKETELTPMEARTELSYYKLERDKRMCRDSAKLD